MLNRSWCVKEKRSNRGYKNCRFSQRCSYAQIDVSQSLFGIASSIHYSRCLRDVIFQDWSMLIHDTKRPTTITNDSFLRHRALLFSDTNGALLSRCRGTCSLCARVWRDSCIQACIRYNGEYADNTLPRPCKTIVATIVVVCCWLTKRVVS